jgi:hypothetical protein
MKRARSLGPTIQSKPDFCPTCDGRRIIKRGLRKNSFRQLQIYFCRDCGRYRRGSGIPHDAFLPRKIVGSTSVQFEGVIAPCASA